MFMLAHLLGWMFKTIIFRNNLMTWTLSIGFEIYEQSLRHWVPNFYECWWDHLILDLFGCNLLGILLGNYILNKFNIPKFHWFFDSNDQSDKIPLKNRLWNSLSNTKSFIDSKRYHFLSSPRNLFIVFWVIMLNSITDLSYFFNKRVLEIQASNYFLQVRIWIIGFFSIIVVKELYLYSRNIKNKHEITYSLFLSHIILLAEVFLFLKTHDSLIIR